MPTSKREALVAGLVTFLTAQLGAGVTIYRRRTRPIPDSADLAVNLVWEDDPRVDSGGKDYVDRALAVDFQIHSRGDTAETAADAVCVALHARLMSDRTISGKCRDVEAGNNDISDDDADENLVVLHQRYVFTYRSSETDLTA